VSQIAAIFDVDGTLVRPSTERLFFVFLLWRGVISPARALGFGRNLLINQTHRYGDKSYLQGFQTSHIEDLARECHRKLIRPRISRVGWNRLRQHQQHGHLVVMLTGSLECLMLPLQQELQAHRLIATRLQRQHQAFQGA
jgi:phosphoserine phosphatase